jgi:HPt (histidine-containing phosphotransfer) domain-containing protein
MGEGQLGQAMERTVITVPEDIFDLIPGFLERRRTDLQALHEELKRGDAAALGFRAHTIKGSAGSFGFDLLSELAAQLEKCGKDADLSHAGDLIERIAKHLENVEVVSE